MFLTRPIFVFSLFLSTLNSFSQDTLQTTESWSRYNEYFILHSDSTFEYTLINRHEKAYGVGTYHETKKGIIFSFDSSYFKQSTYTCNQDISDTIALKVISSYDHLDITTYSYNIGPDKNFLDWDGKIAIPLDADSVVISYSSHAPIIIYPKKERCTCYWIELGFRHYPNNEHLIITSGEVVFKRKTLGQSGLYIRQYDAETDMIYSKLDSRTLSRIPTYRTAPFLLKKQ